MILFSFSMLWTVLYGFTMGVVLAGCYDLFRIRRIAMSPTHCYGARPDPVPLSQWQQGQPKKDTAWLQILLIGLEDLLFGIFCGIILAVMLFYATHGRIRVYAMMAVGVGFFCYRLTLGRWIVRMTDALVALLRRWLHFLYRITLLPIKKSIGAWIKHRWNAVKYRHQKYQTKRYFQMLPQRLFPNSESKPQKEE